MRSFLSLLLFGSSLIYVGASHGSKFSDRVHARQHRGADMAKRQPDISLSKRQENYRFLNNQTQPYLVESLPDVPFDIGEMYSGNVDIDAGNSSRTLFFAFYPKIGDASEDLTIWLNGGPGCSSLEGFFQENGPFVWQPGTLAPVVNDYSWSK